jgi:hypothetical protein
MTRIAEIIGTENIPGYRVRIHEGATVIASQFFKVEGGFEKYKEKIEACYAEAKRFAAGFRCS